ncbi:jg7753 [Pararge aegeria aegeria]|uniref:Jg7753 protein n=1 Tax=Pararge aegeria aegeria TaxID=348720 RepID=A0A8S4RYQ2_9NEOP|nr:jg7753 [Pararge aegeria aegeria]
MDTTAPRRCSVGLLPTKTPRCLDSSPSGWITGTLRTQPQANQWRPPRQSHLSDHYNIPKHWHPSPYHGKYIIVPTLTFKK